MMNDNDQEPWDRLVHAARHARAAEPSESDQHAPVDFISRLRLLRKNLWTFAKSYLWRRWSLGAVAVALVLYFLAHLLLKQDPAPIIAPPDPPNPISP